MKDRPAYPIFNVGACSVSEKRKFLDIVIPALEKNGLTADILLSDVHLFAEKELEPYRSRFATCPEGSGLLSFLHERARRTDIVFYFETDSKPGEGVSALNVEASHFLEKPDEKYADMINRASEVIAKRPVWGCILIGGKSSRMGQPKHLLRSGDGTTWLEKSVGLLGELTAGVALSGRGDIPDSLTGLPRLADIPGIEGPLAGMTAAARWQPDVAWLVIACDMPGVSAASVTWLLDNRRLGGWGVVPCTAERGRLEPLFAIYEPQAGPLFENMQLQSTYRIRAVADCDKVHVYDIPEDMKLSWQNVNTPEELQRFAGKSLK